MNQKKLAAMKTGGRRLAVIRDRLAAAVAPGVTPLDLEEMANTLIDKSGGQASFKMVPRYHYATCINVNSGVVHGLPTATPFRPGDLVSIDLGLYYHGYHTDTSTTVVVGPSTPAQRRFLSTGRRALQKGIAQAHAGHHVSAISAAIEAVISSAGYQVIRSLTGHGIGRQLHENPYVPNFTHPSNPDPVLKVGQALAIEPMYTMGNPQVRLDSDGWTISTADGSLSALVEETIIITPRGPQVLTAS